MWRIDKHKRIGKHSSGQADICEGPLAKNIILYTLPIIASGILQLLFNAADSIVVGRYAGDIALAAVGSTGALVNLIVNVLLGLSIGTSVNVAHAWGARDNRAVSEVVHTSVLTAFIGGIGFGIVGFFASEWLLGLMATPDNVIGQASLYMEIYFLGLPAMMVYNFSASIMRSTGDSKNPLKFLLVGGVVNVLLNLIFVIVFGMAVEGVALATVISQIVSGGLSVRHLMKIDGPHRLHLKKLKIHRARLKKIMIIGIPAGLQGTVFSLSNVVIQSSVNSFLSVAMTGNSAASNIEGFIYISMNAFYHTALTFVGQHIGAKKTERIKKVVLLCLLFVTITGLIIGLAAYIFRTPLLELYIPNNPEAVAFGIERMTIICTTYFICGIMDVFTGCLRGLGASMTPMIISLLGACASRIIWVSTIFKIYHTMAVLYLCYPISWLLTVIAQLTCYLIIKKRTINRINATSQLEAGAVEDFENEEIQINA